MVEVDADMVVLISNRQPRENIHKVHAMVADPLVKLLEMLEEPEIELTRDEMSAMQSIDNAQGLGQTTASTPAVSKRLVEQGYVTKDESGHLILTPKGKNKQWES